MVMLEVKRKWLIKRCVFTRGRPFSGWCWGLVEFDMERLSMSKCIRSLVLLTVVAGTRGAGTTQLSLAQALLEDMLPPASARCVGGNAAYTYQYTSSDSTSSWDETSEMYEANVFLAELSHTEANSNRTWKLRVGKGGNMYSFVGPFGETVPPQYHTDAPWVDEVRLTVAMLCVRVCVRVRVCDLAYVA